MSDKRSDYLSWTSILWGLPCSRACAQRSEYAGGLLHREPGQQDPVHGYNGFPIGCSDDEFPWARGSEDPLETKYVYSTHSELNAILNYSGGSLAGAKLYVTLFPCNECAKAIIQCGIKEVIYDCDKYADTPGRSGVQADDGCGGRQVPSVPQNKQKGQDHVMKRILMMVLRNLFMVPYGWIRLCYRAAHVDKYTEEDMYRFLTWIDLHANRGGNVHIDVHGRRISLRRTDYVLPEPPGALRRACHHRGKPPSVFCCRKEGDCQYPVLKQIFACMKA